MLCTREQSSKWLDHQKTLMLYWVSKTCQSLCDYSCSTEEWNLSDNDFCFGYERDETSFYCLLGQDNTGFVRWMLFNFFYWIQYWNRCVWFTRSRCLLKNLIGWFPVWYPFRYICYSSDSYRCWWCQLRKQCQSGIQHPPGTAVFLSGSRNRLVIHQSYFCNDSYRTQGSRSFSLAFTHWNRPMGSHNLTWIWYTSSRWKLESQ